MGDDSKNDVGPDGMLALSLAVAERQWPHTDDARTWADRWIEAVEKNPAIATDRGTMIGWFANAIMAGHDVAMARQATTMAESERKPIEQVVAEAGYDPDAIGEHDLNELDRFREVIRLHKEGKRMIREGKDMILRSIALAESDTPFDADDPRPAADATAR